MQNNLDKYMKGDITQYGSTAYIGIAMGGPAL